MLWLLQRAQHVRIEACIFPTTKRSFAFSVRFQFPRQPRFTAGHVAKQSSPPPLSFREAVARSADEKPFTKAMGRPSVKNQCLFFLGVSTFIFTWAAWRTNQDTAEWSRRLTQDMNRWSRKVTATFAGRKTSDNIRRAKFLQLREDLTRWGNKIIQIQILPVPLRRLMSSAYTTVAQNYLDATEGRRMCYKITAVNFAVWIFWKLPSLRPAMMARFVHHPLSGLSYTMLTSMFSHRSFLHLLFNSLTLVSFGSAATHWLAKQQKNDPTQLLESTANYHFLAFFVSAGLFSSLTSHAVTAWFRYPRMVSQLAAARSPSAVAVASAKQTATVRTTVSEILPSLGASGAIYSTLVLTSLGFPDLHIGLTIPPSFPIPIQYGVGGLVIMDCIGILRGWRRLDHLAHLGGAMFGAAYYLTGGRLWNQFRLWTGAPPGD